MHVYGLPWVKCRLMHAQQRHRGRYRRLGSTLIIRGIMRVPTLGTPFRLGNITVLGIGRLCSCEYLCILRDTEILHIVLVVTLRAIASLVIRELSLMLNSKQIPRTQLTLEKLDTCATWGAYQEVILHFYWVSNCTEHVGTSHVH